MPPPVPSPTSHSTTSVPAPAPAQRALQSADQLNARLPPQLLALRMAGMGGAGASAPASPGTNTPEKERRDQSPSSANTNGGTGAAARRLSSLAMTSKDEKEATKLYERRASAGEGMYGPPPILVNPKCSGYFVEPVRPSFFRMRLMCRVRLTDNIFLIFFTVDVDGARSLKGTGCGKVGLSE